MKENKYDDPAFFQAYRRFPRSVEGLSAAGEWPQLQRLLPPLAGKRVLDIGCGYGWHCRYAAEQGAASVLGVDISQKMLAEARSQTTSPAIQYQCLPIEDLAFPPDCFDLVLSSLAFHYTPAFSQACQAVAQCLAPGGDFIFSVEHPIFTASGPQAWAFDSQGQPAHWPVDRYFSQGHREAVFLGQPITKYHRTLEGYISPLLAAGFRLTALVEPQPSEALLQAHPDMRQELRRPMMLLIAAQKEGKGPSSHSQST